jgi:integrase
VAGGSVFKRNGKWAFRVDGGFNPQTGRRRQISRQGFDTKKDAQLALAKVVEAVDKNAVVARSTVRLGEYLDEWLANQRNHLRVTTLRSYEIAIQRINRRIGRLRLQALTPMQVEMFYNDLLAEGSSSGKPLAPKTVKNTHVVLRKALSDAERLGLVPRNVASAARAPTAHRPEFDTWSSDDLKAFFESIKNNRMRAAFVVLATTGMRRGELLGLRWRDVDLDAAQLSIVQSLTTVRWKPVVTPTKTQRSRRTIYLDTFTVDALRAHRKRQKEDQLAAGAAWDSSQDLVFRDEVGGLVHPDAFSREFLILVREAGLTRIRLHDLRHTYATLALKTGVHPKVVSERLGHATVGITLDLYSHVTPGIARDAAQAVASTIFQ